MNRAERTYRALLRLYPRAFRDRHGEALVGTLLDALPDGAGRPRLSDAADLAIGAVREHARQLVAPEARELWLDGAALAAEVAVALHAAVAVVVAWRVGSGARRTYFAPSLGELAAFTGVFAAALVLLAFGWRRAAAAVHAGAVVAVVAVLSHTSSFVFAIGDRFEFGAAAASLLLPGLVLALTARRPTRLRAGQLLGGALGTAALLGLAILVQPGDTGTRLGLAAGAGLLAVAGVAGALAASDPRWPVAVAVLGLPLPLGVIALVPVTTLEPLRHWWVGVPLALSGLAVLAAVRAVSVHVSNERRPSPT